MPGCNHGRRSDEIAFPRNWKRFSTAEKTGRGIILWRNDMRKLESRSYADGIRDAGVAWMMILNKGIKPPGISSLLEDRRWRADFRLEPSGFYGAALSPPIAQPYRRKGGSFICGCILSKGYLHYRFSCLISSNTRFLMGTER
jgi:hypothetical protein